MTCSHCQDTGRIVARVPLAGGSLTLDVACESCRLPDMTPPEASFVPPETTDGPIHFYFSLSYCSYLVLHRSVLRAMPLDWQRAFVALVKAADEAVRASGVERPDHYRVTPVGDGGRFAKEALPLYRHAPADLLAPKDGAR